MIQYTNNNIYIFIIISWYLYIYNHRDPEALEYVEIKSCQLYDASNPWWRWTSKINDRSSNFSIAIQNQRRSTNKMVPSRVHIDRAIDGTFVARLSIESDHETNYVDKRTSPAEKTDCGTSSIKFHPCSHRETLDPTPLELPNAAIKGGRCR